MSKELIVQSSPHETRLAILEEDQLVELHVENESQHALAGSIYKGRVTRVLPGMQSAFVDIGLERDAFLYVSDFFDESDEEFDQVPVAPTKAGEPKPSGAPGRDATVPRDVATEQAGSQLKNNSVEESDSTRDSDSTQEKGREADGGGARRREKRGRRSRRRRGKGSAGFPTTKYADVGAENQPGARVAPEAQITGVADLADEAAEALEATVQDVAAESDFVVLPGESLAKYGEGVPEPSSGRSDSQELDSGAGDLSEPSESGLAVGGSVPDDAALHAQDESPSSLELVLPESEEESDEVAEAAAAVEGSSTRRDSQVVADDVSPRDVAPELPTSEPSVEQEPAESTAEVAPEEADELLQALDSDAEHHSFPGFPEPPPADSDENGGALEEEVVGALNGNGNGDSASDASGDTEPREDATEAGDSTASNGSPREARVRGDAGSSSFVHRHGRRGRRRSQRQRDESEKQSVQVAAPVVESGRSDRDSDRKINDMLAKGQEVLVQIAKEPLGKKGARITSHIALPGRFLVYMPTVDHIGVSRKIPSDKERVRLRKIVQTHRTGMPGGFIVRTAGDGVSEEDVRGDMLFLYNQWLDIRDRADGSPSPALLHHDDNVVERVLRDRVGDDFKTIWVDGEAEYERILRFVERFQPDLLKGVKLYTRAKPMFDEFNITAELAKALRPKVWLKSGGYLVINQTEALVAIDVNTGKYVGKSDRLEDTIVNTNLEAVNAIVRQLRVRDLGGIIVVDFIDMEDRSNRHKVLAAIEKALKADMAPSKVLPFNEFGLVCITRKRVKQSLERALCTPCPYCNGSATVKSVQTVIQEILSEARKMATSQERTKDITLRVNQDIARKLKSRDNNYVQEIEQIMRGHVLVRSDVSLHREHFDIG